MTKNEQLIQADRWLDGRAIVRTAKGAPFIGTVVAKYYNQHMGHWGAVVVADDLHFRGITHVYPITQLMEVFYEN